MCDCLAGVGKAIIRCLSCIFCDCLCCQCNCIIFPAPRPSFLKDYASIQGEDVLTTFLQFNTNGKTIPYAEISTVQSKKSKKCFIYFHGNAEDIGIVSMFLEQIVQATNITFYSIEYPTYSTYSTCCPALISNKIKEDSLEFYDFMLRDGRSTEDIYVMGRSIGSGGASYLGGHRNVPLLILMSPFDNIKSVAKGMVGCFGGIIKQHFDNQEEIVNFNGELLVIHGQADEVINVRHGRRLLQTYKDNSYRNSPITVFPRKMSHNSFDMERDIVNPIVSFLKR